jgi:hypothetical protein
LHEARLELSNHSGLRLRHELPKERAKNFNPFDFRKKNL